jgi:hypothetical protein
MPLLLDTLRPGPAIDLRGRNCLTVGLVNNMPDAACEATERQFLKLLRAASSDVVVLLKLFSVAAVPRSEATRADLAGRYAPSGRVSPHTPACCTPTASCVSGLPASCPAYSTAK